MSYDIAVSLRDIISTKNIQVIIADEAHYLKDYKTKRTQSLKFLLMKTAHIILLTGTPALARPKDLFLLLHILRPDIFGYMKKFGDRYC